MQLARLLPPSTLVRKGLPSPCDARGGTFGDGPCFRTPLSSFARLASSVEKSCPLPFDFHPAPAFALHCLSRLGLNREALAEFGLTLWLAELISINSSRPFAQIDLARRYSESEKFDHCR